MALLTSPGATSIDLATTGTHRDDLSEYLMASLMVVPTLAGAIRVGPEFVGNVFKWTEDRLNSEFVTDTQAGGLLIAGTTITVSSADAAVLDVGYVLADNSATLGGLGQTEHLQITAISGTTVTLTRAYDGTTAVAHAQNAQYYIIAKPTIEASDLGRDMSRARVPKVNYIQRHEINCTLSQEILTQAKYGYTPGIQDELEYDFWQRTMELLRAINRSLIYAKGNPGSTGTTNVAGGNYSTFHGLRSMLDTTFNSTSTVIDFVAQGWAVGDLKSAIDYANKQLYRGGATPDWALGGPNCVDAVGRLYKDQIRLQQDETTRGFVAMYFRSAIGNELRMMLDGYVYDTDPKGDVYVLDSSRFRIRPAAEAFFYSLMAPTLRDADSVRAMCKLSFECRNTGSDTGQAGYVIKNVSFGVPG